MSGDNRCFLLWRDGDRLVASVRQMSHTSGMPNTVSFAGELCRELGFAGFFNFLVCPNSGRLVGFSIQLVIDADERALLDDLVRAANVTDVRTSTKCLHFYIVLSDEQPFDEDSAQEFFVQGWLTPAGRPILSLPDSSCTLPLGFEIVTQGAPEVT